MIMWIVKGVGCWKGCNLCPWVVQMWDFVFNMHSLFLGYEGYIRILCFNVYSIFDHIEFVVASL